MVMTLAAMAAGGAFNFNEEVSWTGTVTGRDHNTTDVTVTDKGGGLYNICIKKLTAFYRDSEITFTNVPGTARGEGVVFSTNGHDIEPEAMVFNIGIGDATGIDGIDAGEECGNIYDVAGKLLKKNGTTKGLKQGIYIMNGKKILK